MADITILLPTYNRRDYLPTALKSIVEQRYTDWRAIVINDGGEDVSDVVATFNEARIEYHNVAHNGKAAALNYGLSLVKSKYIAYMDDDDIWYNNHLELLYPFARENDYDFVYSDTLVLLIDAQGEVLKRYVENRADVTWNDLKYQNHINHKQILHSKRLAEKTGKYDERLSILIDYDYIRRMSRHAKPYHMATVTGEHNIRFTNAQRKVDSITGRWDSDPEGCGRSILYIYEKSPEVMSEIYRQFAMVDSYRKENEHLRSLVLKQQKLIDKLKNRLD